MDEKNIDSNIGKKSAVLFSAVWCPGCRGFKPIFEEMEKNFPDITFAKADVSDMENSLNEKFNIGKIPTVIFFENSKEISRISSDFLRREDLTNLLEGNK